MMPKFMFPLARVCQSHNNCQVRSYVLTWLNNIKGDRRKMLLLL